MSTRSSQGKTLDGAQNVLHDTVTQELHKIVVLCTPGSSPWGTFGPSVEAFSQGQRGGSADESVPFCCRTWLARWAPLEEFDPPRCSL